MKRKYLKRTHSTLARSLAATLATGMAWGAAVSAAEDDFVSTEVCLFEAGVICAQASNVVRDAPDTLAGGTHVIEDARPLSAKGSSCQRCWGSVSGFDPALPWNWVKIAF